MVYVEIKSSIIVHMSKLSIGILAHVDAGKTTLSEAMLYECGILKSIGRVDNKDTFLDTDSMEKDRGITIFSKLARMKYDDADIILVDTPGHVDFGVEMERTLAILDLAVLLVSASEGVKAHTKTLFKLLKSYNIPTIIFVNKMDMDGVSFDKVFDQIKSTLSDNAVSFMTDDKPQDSAVNGEVCNYPYEDIATMCEEYSYPYEDIATSDEELLEEYLNSGVIEEAHIFDAVKKRYLFPVLSGSALKNDGVERLLYFITQYANNLAVATDDKSISLSAKALKAYCYKCSYDNKGVKLSHFKIVSGSLKVKEFLGGIKVNELRQYSGNAYENTDTALTGDVITIPGDNEFKSGKFYDKDSATDDDSKTMHLSPVLSYAVKFPKEFDNVQVLAMLRTVEEELPELQVVYDEEHREIKVYLMGEVQTQILKRIMLDRFNLPISFDTGKITYKETIDDVVEGVGHFEPLRHYAEVHLKLEPLPRGEGMQFETDVSEDDLDLNWQRLIMTHLNERTHRGVLTGAPVTDMKITVIGGRAHTKHTEGGDFRQATYRAVRQGLMQATCRLLEPYYDYTLEIPDSYVGKAMTDIDRMNGTSFVTESADGVTVINGRAPVATMHGYGADLMAYTKGEGKLSLNLGGYDICHNEEEVITKRGYDPELDKYNPSSSVFCRHGAGDIVPWYEVFDNMHVPQCLSFDGGPAGNDITKAQDNMEAARANRARMRFASDGDIAIGTEEIDKIIDGFSSANKKEGYRAHKGISVDRQLSAVRRREYGTDNSKSSTSTEDKYAKKAEPKDKYILIDGYNVMHANEELKALIEINVDGARDKFIDIVDHYASVVDEEIILVFDAYKLKNHRAEFFDYNRIHIVYTATAQTADGYIEKFSHDNSKKYDITVATSDNAEQTIILGHGCSVVPSKAFLKMMDERLESVVKEYKDLHS